MCAILLGCASACGGPKTGPANGGGGGAGSWVEKSLVASSDENYSSLLHGPFSPDDANAGAAVILTFEVYIP